MVPQLHVTARLVHAASAPMHTSHSPPTLSRVFPSLLSIYCLPCFSLPFFLYLLIQAPPSFSRALSPQSRFAAYFQNPLKASHFRIFHSTAAHQLCHSPGRERASQRADTRHSPPRARARLSIHTCARNLPQLIVFQHGSVYCSQISGAEMGFAGGNKQCNS